MDRSLICDESNPAFDSIAGLITARSGIVIASRERQWLCLIIKDRIGKNGLDSIADYDRLLQGIRPDNREWLELLHQLIIGETYFFRDRGQTDLLKDHLLPQLIDRNRLRRELRIWSAGCSTGEELYSIAILLSQILQTPEDWLLLLLGTNINHRALEKAESGIFGDWSFRNTDPLLKQRYFRRKHRS
ncbi:hypothetical protein BOW51_11270 [Solemya velesiana gill symbiont]|uniref:protein-glutamate O-methyltransferase n=1 Tax=Solemya velesiana gill symbiont TaxID=1918948 RepID=A0A1T2KS34_9GAMM|nr:hypothetical protein BOW51_11270 [Solemya velesiana gill symbiont]